MVVGVNQRQVTEHIVVRSDRRRVRITLENCIQATCWKKKQILLVNDINSDGKLNSKIFLQLNTSPEHRTDDLQIPDMREN